MVTTDQSRRVTVPDGWSDPTEVARPRSVGRRLLPLLVWLACLAVAVGLLLTLGGGRLAAPALTRPGTWGAWAAGRDPVEVVVVVLRVLGLGIAWYLAGVTSISVIARALRAARLVRIADALSFGPVRTIAQQAVGVSLAAGVLVTSVPGPTPATDAGSGTAADAGTVVMTVAPEDDRHPDVTATVAVEQARGAPTAALRPVRGASPGGADAGAEPTTPPSTPPVPAPSATAPEARPGTPPPGTGPDEPADAQPAPSEPSGAGQPTDVSRQVRVRPGDHLWALAERDVRAHLGREPSEAEVASHWQQVVEVNRPHLRVPENPDLLFPGQLVVLPAVTEVAP